MKATEIQLFAPSGSRIVGFLTKSGEMCKVRCLFSRDSGSNNFFYEVPEDMMAEVELNYSDHLCVDETGKKHTFRRAMGVHTAWCLTTRSRRTPPLNSSIRRFSEGNSMRIHVILIAVVAFLSTLAGPALADQVPTKGGTTAHWMIKQETIWANMACGGKWIALDVFADDFQGTSPKGSHYGKPKSVPKYDKNTKWSTDCRVDSADVRFFSPDVAIVYGAESKTVALQDSKHERRCLAWTDTWLKRKGKWQLISAQDIRIECPAK